ncbi:glycine oxidase ThiO [Paenibacillus naphthalenovorans]|uniref:glycine oxidase ThiO n=1 Tax=Paenibacillus naphthalenovorans TaxID=162209 RepID=UPI0010B051BE|nr:glycine oxidase ThiO [Paenibacillus naphthalenovorans]GCL70971.1 glycine oxidase ThiO [Paenibacillus naphthalenovorans]
MSTAAQQTGGRTSAPTAIIIGGGVIGCAAAFELSKAGYACTLLDKGAIHQEASTAAAGMLGAQVEIHQPGPFYELCRQSQEIYKAWIDELEQIGGVTAQYIGKGILRAALTEEDELELRSRLSWIQNADWMKPEDMRRIEPELSAEVRGGLHFHADHQVHPVWLAKSLSAAIVRQGCRIREWTPVFKLLTEPGTGRICGVQTSEGPLYADIVVLASGAWSPALTGPLGIKLDMFPVKGQCISVKTGAPIIRSTVFTHGCYIVPKLDGSYIIGATQAEAGFDKQVTVKAIAELHGKAAALLPRIEEAEFISSWAGLRPGTRDGLPYLGETSELPGLIFATGHYRNGILLAPVTGRIVAQIAAGDKPLEDLKPFSPMRDSAKATASL